MPEYYTVTYVDVVQEVVEAESELEAVGKFLATGEGGDDVLDLTRNSLYVHKGPSFGEDWFGTAADLAEGTPYEVEECDEHDDCHVIDNEHHTTEAS